MSAVSGDPPRWLSRLVVVVSIAVIVAVHAPLIGYKSFANVDEAYASALAERLLEGYRLYDGAVSQRGPLMYYAYEAIAWLHGWDNVVALRLWALALALTHLLLVGCLGRALLSGRAALVATALSGYALSFGFPAFDACALHGETLQLPALLGATWVGALGMRKPTPSSRRRWLVGAGLLFGVAGSVKQSVLLHPAALLLWLAVDARRRRRPLRALVGDGATLVLPSVVVPLVFAFHSWREGTLRELVYYCVTYNREVHLRPAPSQAHPWLPNLFFRLTDETSFFLLLVALCACAAPFVLRRVRAALRERSLRGLGRGFGIRQFLACNLVIALGSAAAMYRFFPHYFLQAWPFAALSAGAAADPIVASRQWGAASRRALAAFAMFTLFCGWMGTIFGEKVDGRLMYDRTVNDVSKLIAATTSADDRIFVWGFSPWVYQFSHRRPAGRYAFETYVTGVVPWFWETRAVESARIVPGSVEALLGDLEREKPAVVVDAGSIMLAQSMRAYAPFSTWLHAHHCFDVRLGAFDVYRRKAHDDDACAVPWSPRPFAAVDWNGRVLGLPQPELADEAITKPLPRGNYFKPIWLKSEPRPQGLDVLRDAKRDEEEEKAKRDGFRIEDVDWEGADF